MALYLRGGEVQLRPVVVVEPQGLENGIVRGVHGVFDHVQTVGHQRLDPVHGVLHRVGGAVQGAANHVPGGLYPDDLQVRAAAERWMDWQVTTVSPTMIPVFRGMIRTAPENRDMDAIQAGRAALSAKMSIINKVLAENAFITGDTFTMGDIPLGIAAWRWFNMPIEREEYPHLKRWVDALGERPGYQRHIMKPVT